jgi:hypothetical protein
MVTQSARQIQVVSGQVAHAEVRAAEERSGAPDDSLLSAFPW